MERPLEEKYHASEMYLWKDAINEYCDKLEEVTKTLEEDLKEASEYAVTKELQAMKDAIIKMSNAPHNYKFERAIDEVYRLAGAKR